MKRLLSILLLVLMLACLLTSCGDDEISASEDEKTEHKVHTEGEDGFCTDCGQPLSATEGVIYGISSDGTYAKVLAYSGTATKVIIADTYENLPVKVIYSGAFEDNNKITKVFIPDSVTEIGSEAFWRCTNLTSVTIGDSVTAIGDDAFRDCDSLESVTIPDSVTAIGGWAFSGCTSLTSVTIPDSVTTIGYGVFQYCTSLESVTIGDSVTAIGSYAFSGCNSSLYTEYEYGTYVGDAENPYAILIGVTNKNLDTYKINEKTKIIADDVFNYCSRLKNITIPNSVTAIGSFAFAYCDSLESVTIGDSVTAIGSSAFSDCDSLESVTIGDSVTTIGEKAFYRCASLTSVTIPDSVIAIGYEAFYGCTSLTDVCYKGGEEEWAAINIDDSGNGKLTRATIHYNYTEE